MEVLETGRSVIEQHQMCERVRFAGFGTLVAWTLPKRELHTNIRALRVYGIFEPESSLLLKSRTVLQALWQFVSV